MSAAAVLRRLNDAGVVVRFREPDEVVLSGPLTEELVELARAAKAELLALVRPRAEVRPCACCGRFFFVEPATTCFWCGARKDGDRRDRSPPESPGAGASVPSVPAFPGPPRKRTCGSCGGGLARGDASDGPCWSCRQIGAGP